MKSKAFVVLGIVILAVIGFNFIGGNGSSRPVNHQVIQAENKFSLQLFKQLAKQNPNQNIVVSPAGLFILLSMTSNGADHATKTAIDHTLNIQKIPLTQLNESNQALLESLENPERKVNIQMANSLWTRKGISAKHDFINRNRVFYQAETRPIDFSSSLTPAIINGWVYKKTHGAIRGVVTQLNPNDVMVLMNAIYFNGEWSKPFNKAKTQRDEFTKLDGSKKLIPMMAQKNKFRYMIYDTATVIELPYGKERFSLIGFLPRWSSDLNTFYQQLNEKNWAKWMSVTNNQPEEVMVYLPHFNMEYQTGNHLKKALINMGMGAAFDANQADFSKAFAPSQADQPTIGEIGQKTKIQVNERGTIAVEISFEIMRTRGGTPTISFNKPFVFVIRDNQTGAILFMGSVCDPK